MGLLGRRRKGSARRPDPVKVGWARNQAEAELIQSLLRDAGIPSMTRRQAGFDVPDFLAAGPRDILVPAEAAERAKEVLADDLDSLPGE